MDAATLRIILLVLGIALLGAMYLWERRRCAARGDDEADGHRSRGSARREPMFGAQDDEEADAPGLAFDADVEPSARRRARIDAAPASIDDLGLDDENEVASAPGDEGASSAGLGQRSAPGSSRPDATGKRLLIQLFVFAGEQAFAGEAIEAAAASHQLVPGEMNIYHRRNLGGSGQRTRFSMANLVKPGTFPFDEMAGFSTPGLALFAELEGLPSDLMVYDELVQTARAMADELSGELRLPDRKPFDDEAWERLRTELLGLINDRADALAGRADAPTAAGEAEGADAWSGPSASAGRSPSV
jgi:cell division protein ZipA